MPTGPQGDRTAEGVIIEKGRTIDLVLRSPGTSAAGSYTIGVLL